MPPAKKQAARKTTSPKPENGEGDTSGRDIPTPPPDEPFVQEPPGRPRGATGYMYVRQNARQARLNTSSKMFIANQGPTALPLPTESDTKD